MTNQPLNKTFLRTFKAEKDFDVIQFVKLLKRLWVWIVLLTGFFIIVAFIISKYTTPVYKFRTRVIIKSNQVNNSLNTNRGFQDMQFRFNMITVTNEVEKLKSFNVVSMVVRKLNLIADYYQEAQFITQDIYTKCPFRVIPDTSYPQPVNIMFRIKVIDKDNYRISVDEENVKLYDYKKDKVIGEAPKIVLNTSSTFGEDINNGFCHFKIVPDSSKFDYSTIKKYVYYFKFNNIYELTNYYHENLMVELALFQTTALDVYIVDDNAQRGVEVLSSIIDQYIQYSMDKSERSLDKMITYIDEQLYHYEDYVAHSENKLQSIQTGSSAVDFSFVSTQNYNKIFARETERNELEKQKKYYEYLKNYIETSRNLDNLIVPSSLNLKDPKLQAYFSELNDLNTQRNNLKIGDETDNPRVKGLDNQINDLLNIILETTNSLIYITDLSINEVDARLKAAELVAYQLPVAQNAAQSVEREGGVQDSLYTYFMQRRTQAQMLRASNRPVFDVVEPAKAIQTIEPKISFALTLALMLGFFCPILFVYLKGELKNVINNTDEIKLLTDIPVIGRILHYEGHKSDDFIQIENSPSIESFRHLRTNLKFFLNEMDKAVILVTSAEAKEGKSFVASNLAALISLLDKKVVLIDADLRKSKPGTDNTDEGLSSYLIHNARFEDIIHTSLFYPNLDSIKSGPVPPNPFELLSSAAMEDVIAQLYDRYDYIFIDTPPVELFPDATAMIQWSDLNLIVVRAHVTNKDVLPDLCNNIQGLGKGKLCIVFNDILLKKKRVWRKVQENQSTFVEL